MQLDSFYTPWKHEKTQGFLVFSVGLERAVVLNGLTPFRLSNFSTHTAVHNVHDYYNKFCIFQFKQHEKLNCFK